MNGECAIVATLPILQPNGQPTEIQVQEQQQPCGVFVTNINYQGSGTEEINNPDGRSDTSTCSGRA